jgi:hypothetical protein
MLMEAPKRRLYRDSVAHILLNRRNNRLSSITASEIIECDFGSVPCEALRNSCTDSAACACDDCNTAAQGFRIHFALPSFFLFVTNHRIN